MDILIFINITTQPSDIPVTFEVYNIHIYIFSPNINKCNKQKVDGGTFFRETTILR